MGAAISALPSAVGIVRRNPVLLVGSVLFGVIVFIGFALAIIPLIGGLLFQIVVLPVGLAGIVAMADAGADGENASLDDFTGGVDDYAGSVIGAYGLFFLVQIAGILALAVVFVFVVALSGFGASTMTESDPSAALAGMGAVTVVVVLLIALAAVVLNLIQQFLDVAVVVGEKDASGALSEAASLVAGGPLSVLGYSLLRFAVIGIAIGGPLALGFAITGVGAEQNTSVLLVPAALLMIVAFPLGISLGIAYHVAYYRERRPPGEPSSDTDGGSADSGTASRGNDDSENADVISPPSVDS